MRINNTRRMRPSGGKFGTIVMLIWLASAFGYIRGLYQLFTSDFDPIGKREMVYGIGACTGLNAIIGYFNISDK